VICQAKKLTALDPRGCFHALRGQDGTNIKIAGVPIQPGFLIETDLKSVQQASIPVYAISEDLGAGHQG
jgi:hypothetical protein